MKMSVRPELTTAPPARVRDMRHTDGAVDNPSSTPNRLFAIFQNIYLNKISHLTLSV